MKLQLGDQQRRKHKPNQIMDLMFASQLVSTLGFQVELLQGTFGNQILEKKKMVSLRIWKIRVWQCISSFLWNLWFATLLNLDWFYSEDFGRVTKNARIRPTSYPKILYQFSYLRKVKTKALQEYSITVLKCAILCNSASIYSFWPKSTPGTNWADILCSMTWVDSAVRASPNEILNHGISPLVPDNINQWDLPIAVSKS